MPVARILVDIIHCYDQNPVDHSLSKGNYKYEEIHGFRRIFNHLRANEYEWDAVREGSLTTELLNKYDVLFINLPGLAQPDFSINERQAIKKFLMDGNGVFIIADHTNCFGHAAKLNPLLASMDIDIQIQYTSALDDIDNCVAKYGWISITHLDKSHPTNQGIEKISFQTGCTLDTPHGTAYLSEHGFGDYWNADAHPHYMGDKKLTLDEDKEPRGSLPLVAALNVGGKDGRLIVVGDQNIYGDIWLHYNDNFKHGLNAFEWCAKKCRSDGRMKQNNRKQRIQKEREPTKHDSAELDMISSLQIHQPLRNTRPSGVNIWVDSYFSQDAPGQTEVENWYSFYVNLNRDPEISALAVHDWERIDQKRIPTTKCPDAFIIPPLVLPLTTKALKSIRAMLDAKRIVILLCEMNSLTVASAMMLHELVPELSIRIHGADPTLSTLPYRSTYEFCIQPNPTSLRILQDNIARLTMSSKLKSIKDGMDVKELKLKNYAFTCVTSTWGVPLLKTGGDLEIDIARMLITPSGGIIIIFLQEEFFRNKYIGSNEAVKPCEKGMVGLGIQYSLMNFIKEKVRKNLES